MATEPLNGGLVTSRPAALLGQGELVRCDNLIYRSTSPSLHKAAGRAIYTTGSDIINGMQACAFDNADDLLIVQRAGRLLRGPLGGVGTLTDIEAFSDGSLDRAHYLNRHVLMNGVNDNRVLRDDGTTRPHGMPAVTSPPGLVHAGAGGTGVFAILGTGWFEYWTTEVFIGGDEEVESTFEGTPSQVNVTSANSTVTITRPTSVSAEATHWRAYRSNKKINPTDGTGFPVGFLIGTVAIATEVFVDGGGTTVAATLAGAGDNNVLDVYGGAGNWTNPGNITADDAAVATSTLVTWPLHQLPTVSAMRAGNFGFASIGNPISDITVTIEARRTGTAAGLRAALSWDGGVTWTAPKALGVSSVFTVVSASGTWGRNWTGSEFDNGIFYVRLEAYGIKNLAAGSIEVDYVKVGLTHGGTTADLTVPFNAIQLNIGGVAAFTGANGQPPKASTGDIFEDSLVMNDVAQPTQLAYSMPGEIDAFPALYRINMDTKEKDTVTCIRALGTSLGVGLRTQLWRINYLPREEDSEFRPGRAIDVIDPDNGVTGPLAMTRFVYDGQPHLAYVSHSGPRGTNLFESFTLTDDLDWPTLANVGRLSVAELINNPDKHELLLYYVPNDSDGKTKCLHLNYHPQQLKNGKLKVSGPVDVSTDTSTVGITSDGSRFIYTTQGGTIYIEERGISDNPITLLTRDIYATNPGNQWEMTRLWTHHTVTEPTELVGTIIAKKADAPARTSPAKTITPNPNTRTRPRRSPSAPPARMSAERTSR